MLRQRGSLEHLKSERWDGLWTCFTEDPRGSPEVLIPPPGGQPCLPSVAPFDQTGGSRRQRDFPTQNAVGGKCQARIYPQPGQLLSLACSLLPQNLLRASHFLPQGGPRVWVAHLKASSLVSATDSTHFPGKRILLPTPDSPFPA